MRGNYGGCIVVYVNTNILCQRKSEYECESYDTIAVELNISKRKWLCISIYSSPAHLLIGFLNEMENILNRAFCKYDYVILMGDYNANILKIDTISNAIKDFWTSFNLTNIIHKPTCFKEKTESLIDLILTNQPKVFFVEM